MLGGVREERELSIISGLLKKGCPSASSSNTGKNEVIRLSNQGIDRHGEKRYERKL